MASSEETPFVTFRIDDDGVVWPNWAPGTQITLELAERSEAIRQSLVGDRALPLLVILDGIRGMDRDARRFYGRLTGPSAVALVVTTPIARVIGNMTTGLTHPVTPVHLCSSAEDAVAWLLATTSGAS